MHEGLTFLCRLTLTFSVHCEDTRVCFKDKGSRGPQRRVKPSSTRWCYTAAARHGRDDGHEVASVVWYGRGLCRCTIGRGSARRGTTFCREKMSILGSHFRSPYIGCQGVGSRDNSAAGEARSLTNNVTLLGSLWEHVVGGGLMYAVGNRASCEDEKNITRTAPSVCGAIV